MEVVDELITPGCPQCAVKHLSAALYHVARGAVRKDVIPDPYMTCVCTAYINLVEVRAGYHSHLWYAVGALVRAEEHMAPRTAGGCVAREARLMLEQYGEEALIDALKAIDEGTAPNHADWAAAHLDEARRELPAMADDMAIGDIAGAIERIRKEYFDLPGAAVAAGGEQPTGGPKDGYEEESRPLQGSRVRQGREGCLQGRQDEKGEEVIRQPLTGRTAPQESGGGAPFYFSNGGAPFYFSKGEVMTS